MLVRGTRRHRASACVAKAENLLRCFDIASFDRTLRDAMLASLVGNVIVGSICPD
jgi:hypothetical protein